MVLILRYHIKINLILVFIFVFGPHLVVSGLKSWLSAQEAPYEMSELNLDLSQARQTCYLVYCHSGTLQFNFRDIKT